MCNVQCRNVGVGVSLSVCSALRTIGGSCARADFRAGTRDELRTSRAAAGGAIGPAVASVGGAAIAPRAIRVCSQRLFFSHIHMYGNVHILRLKCGIYLVIQFRLKHK